jgi:HK97 family phage major capsid protein
MTNTTIKSSLTDSAGKYLVPEPLANSIWENIQNKSAVIPFLTKMPMGSATLSLNAVDNDIEMTWVSTEGGAKTVSNEDYKQVTLTAYELAVVVTITDILLEDSNVEMVSHIRGEIEDAVVRALEQSYLGYYDGTPFAQTISGDCPAAHTIAAGTGDDLLVDISQALQAIETDGFTNNIGFVTHPSVKHDLRSLRDDNGQPILQPASSSEPATLFGYPIRFTRNMVQTGSPAAYELIGADWKYLVEGVRNQMNLAKTSVGTVGSHNLFTENKTAIKAHIRRGFAIRDVNAICKVTGL